MKSLTSLCLGAVHLMLVLLFTWGLLAVAGDAAHSAQARSSTADWDALKRLPDWSGVWAPEPPGPPQKSTVAGKAPEPSAAGGVFGFGLPLKPKYAAMRDERMAAVRGDRGRDNIPWFFDDAEEWYQ